MQGSPVSASSGRQLHELYQLPTPFPQLCSFRGFPNFWPNRRSQLWFCRRNPKVSLGHFPVFLAATRRRETTCHSTVIGACPTLYISLHHRAIALPAVA